MSLALNSRKLVPSDEWRGSAGRLLIAWLVTMISMPIIQWIWGDSALLAGVVVSVVLQGGLAVLFLAEATSLRRLLLTVSGVALIAWTSEAVGSETGFPFGVYHYTASLQPQLLGVPLLIPLAWLMMLPPAWAVAQRITGRTHGFVFVVVSALAFTAWDLFLDPQMVHWGLWKWDQPGQYFGIPLVNYAGWLLVSGIITAVVRPPRLPQRPLLTLYCLTWLIETVGLVLFWGLYGPAAAGFLGMGAFTLAAWRRGRAGSPVAQQWAGAR